MVALEQMRDTSSPLICRIVQRIQSTFADEDSGHTWYYIRRV